MSSKTMLPKNKTPNNKMAPNSNNKTTDIGAPSSSAARGSRMSARAAAVVTQDVRCVDQWLRFAEQQMRTCGMATPRLDARLLLGHITYMDAAAVIAGGDRVLSAGEIADLQQVLSRRLAHEPVSRIVGTREFYGRNFVITPDTLDPRPDSETVIECVLQRVDAEGWREKDLRILDIGTGSGCLLLTLLAELPHATGLGTDISQPALDVAVQNAQLLKLSARATFVNTNLIRGINEKFDIGVSNPPYIASDQLKTLERDVFEYDPHLALDGGEDGLDCYRKLANGICSIIPEGWVVFEVGHQQADAVAALMLAANPGIGAENSLICRDLGGHRRCVAMRSR